MFVRVPPRSDSLSPSQCATKFSSSPDFIPGDSLLIFSYFPILGQDTCKSLAFLLPYRAAFICLLISEETSLVIDELVVAAEIAT